MGCEASVLLDDHRKNECVFVRVGNCCVQVYCSWTKQRCPDKGQVDQHLVLFIYFTGPYYEALKKMQSPRALEDSSEQVGREREGGERE